MRMLQRYGLSGDKGGCDTGYLTKKSGKLGNPDIYAPTLAAAAATGVSHLDETGCLTPSATQDLCSSVPSEESTLAPLALESEKEGKEEGKSGWVSVLPGSPEFAAWTEWNGGALQPNVQGEYVVPSRWPRRSA